MVAPFFALASACIPHAGKRSRHLHLSSTNSGTLPWPLRVGDTHTHWLEFRRALLGTNAGKATWNVRVVGWEEITVPAGKFRALKIEGDGIVERYDASMTFPVKVAAWYVPEVNRYAKSWFQNPEGRRGVELTGYRLNK